MRYWNWILLFLSHWVKHYHPSKRQQLWYFLLWWFLYKTGYNIPRGFASTITKPRRVWEPIAESFHLNWIRPKFGAVVEEIAIGLSSLQTWNKNSSWSHLPRGTGGYSYICEVLFKPEGLLSFIYNCHRRGICCKIYTDAVLFGRRFFLYMQT